MRFGVEIELNDLDGRDFSADPLRPGEMPKGYDLVVDLVAGLGLEVQAHGWRQNHNNSVWICKPDSSCGMELCSPVLDESRLGEVLEVVEAIGLRPELRVNEECALHVHVDVSHLVSGIPESSEGLCSVLAWWVKCEAVVLDSMPPRRRDSRFCRCIGFTDLFGHDEKVVPCMTVSKLRDKYLTVNTHHMVSRKRNSIEFRPLEGTKDPALVSDWVRFVLNFVRRSADSGLPDDYTWLSLEGVEELISSDPCSAWLRARIGENHRSDTSRFWRSRLDCEIDRLSAAGIFGPMDASFVPLGDK